MYLVLWYSEGEDHCETHTDRSAALASFGELFGAVEGRPMKVIAAVYKVYCAEIEKIAYGSVH